MNTFAVRPVLKPRERIEGRWNIREVRASFESVIDGVDLTDLVETTKTGSITDDGTPLEMGEGDMVAVFLRASNAIVNRRYPHAGALGELAWRWRQR